MQEKEKVVKKMFKKINNTLIRPAVLVVALLMLAAGASVSYITAQECPECMGIEGYSCPYPSGCASFGCQSTIASPSDVYCSTYAVQQGASCPNRLDCISNP